MSLVLALVLCVSVGDAAYRRADALFVARKFPEALAAVNEALRLDARFVPALTLKAKMALATREFGVASKCLERALEVDAQSGYAQFLYGLTAYMSNEMKQALPRFEKARVLMPKDPRTALYLGLTKESLGQSAEALALYEEAAARDPDALLPGVRLLLLMGRVDESERWARRAVMAAPASRDAHFELGRVLMKKGEATEAAAQGELALTLSDGVTPDAAIHYVLIRAWQRAGQPAKAAQHAEVLRAEEGREVKR